MQGRRRPEIPPPSVELTPLGVSPTSVSFKIAPSDALTVAYAVAAADAEIPGAAEILASGVRADPSREKEYSADGLSPATEYVIAAAAGSGDAVSEVRTLKMNTAAEPAPEWDVETRCINIIAEYYGNEKLGGENGHFWINVTDMEVDERGTVLTDGIQYCFSLHSDLAADPENPVPAAGAYAFDLMDTFDKFTVDNGYSKWITLENIVEDPVQKEGKFMEGTVELACSEGFCELTALMTTTDGLVRRITYSGPVKWLNKTTPPVQDRNLDAVYAEAIYYGTGEDNPDSDNWVLALYDSPDAAGAMLVLDFYSAVSSDPNSPSVPSGTWVPGDGAAAVAGTFTPGYNYSGLYDLGTYYSFMANGKSYTYYLSGGSFTVSGDGDGCTVTAELAMDDGTKVTGSFSGVPRLVNNFDPALGADLNVAYDRVYNGPGDYYSGGMNEYYFCLADTEMTAEPAPAAGGEGNWLALDLLSATAPSDLSDIAIPEGVYTWNEEGTDGTFDPGFSFGWHWDSDGVRYLVNPVSGTVAVRRSGEEYSITVEWITDKDEKLYGTYTGPIPFVNRSMSSPALHRKMLYGRNALSALRPHPAAGPLKLRPAES